jgi:hypothetical protein
MKKKKKIKHYLKYAFDAPESERKRKFLLSVDFPRASRFDFVTSQIGYIRKKVWIISILAAAIALFSLRFQTGENILRFIRTVSAILPFVALTGLTEISRSMSYNMAELEMSCKYNFSGVILARLGILSGTNLITLIIFMLSFWSKSGFGIFRLAIYLFMPFLLTCALSLFAINHIRSRENIYICGATSCFTGVLNTVFHDKLNVIFTEKYLFLHAAAFIFLLVWTAGEIIKLIKKTEGIQWNLSSIN